jgi:PhoPQ-activated pathogenicity-related protein
MTWQFRTNSTRSVVVEVAVHPAASRFRVWTAESSERDFRKARWSAVELDAGSGTNAVAKIEAPSAGFRAYLVEAELSASTGDIYKLSTEARVLPDGPPAPGHQPNSN